MENIRRNEQGHMLYIDARELLALCVEHHVIHAVTANGQVGIGVYMSGSEKRPDGWYLIPMEDAIQDVMRKDDAISAMINALKDKGVEFVPSAIIPKMGGDR